ncbi:MAG: DNA-3-methyladenine glycosylase I [Symploca sp. SIO2G7]|nr:DNA-3-methyladenine glycosylase I [Symploca sp. SIO2G7]
MDGLITGADKRVRCWWPGDDSGYLAYHDHEWGWPTKDDTRLFEKICLEGFQAGLSWLTILRKRDNFRNAFNQFQFEQVARYTKADVERLLNNTGIVRHRRKIESTINNAQRACDLVDEYGSLAAYFWQYEPAKQSKQYDYATLSQLNETSESTVLSQDLKKRGWSFVGPTTAYAFMQAMGLVNDHLEGCFAHQAVEVQRALFERP